VDGNTLLAVNETVAETYHRMLKVKGVGEPAIAYLRKRGVAKETVLTYRLGYAPNSWDWLAGEMGPSEAAAAGLATVHDDQTYDLFRNRIMFPILSARGVVVGFGGRNLEDDEPKYLNSPDTVLFSKGRTLYGLPQAYDSIRETGEMIVVEGYFDVVMAYQGGVKNVVATLGTRFGDNHVRLAKALTDRVLFVYDRDDPGEKALKEAMDRCAGAGLFAMCSHLEPGFDPSEHVALLGGDSFRSQIESTRDLCA